MNYETTDKYMRKYYDARNGELREGRKPRAAYLGEREFKALHNFVGGMRTTMTAGKVTEFEGVKVFLVLEENHLAFISV